MAVLDLTLHLRIDTQRKALWPDLIRAGCQKKLAFTLGRWGFGNRLRMLYSDTARSHLRVSPLLTALFLTTGPEDNPKVLCVVSVIHLPCLPKQLASHVFLLHVT